MPRFVPESPEFLQLLNGNPNADLVRIALEIARDACPGLEFGPYLQQLDQLAERVRFRIPEDAPTRLLLQQINWVLYVEEGFTGNDSNYFDPNNSYLNEVLDRRTGIPISLGVLYRGVAERLGLPLHGVNLPAHFVLRADQESVEPVFIDPFHGGRLLDRDACQNLVASRSGAAVELTEEQFRPMSTAEVVARMLRNLRALHLQSGDAVLAFAVLKRLVALEPMEGAYRRDLGIVALGLDRLDEGIEQLSAYLEQEQQATDAGRIRSLILDARQRRAEGDGPAAG
ncbi:SirB1 family protein [Tautonia marina]|uniref:SirB1 family protein n=1 Tax=Tautonia marina TaxID=2653855 RepID=UPI001F2F3E9F|nr:transglutaminase-like domain-containing protein [Tautonia marina]